MLALRDEKGVHAMTRDTRARTGARTYRMRLRNENPADDREWAALEAEVKTEEAHVRNITAAIAKSGFSEALGEQLGAEEETLRALRQRLAARSPAGDRTAPVPDPDADARFLVPVRDPDGTRRYEARGALNATRPPSGTAGCLLMVVAGARVAGFPPCV
jgi:hypothetical protein